MLTLVPVKFLLQHVEVVVVISLYAHIPLFALYRSAELLVWNGVGISILIHIVLCVFRVSIGVNF